MNVPLSTRYETAHIEIAERIAIRQHLKIYFVLLNFGYLAFHQRLEQTADQSGILFPTIIAVLAISFSCWVGHQDCIIGLLGSFCRAASAEEPSSEKKHMPDWFSRSQLWGVEGAKFRMFSYVTYSLCVFAACLPSVALLVSKCKDFWASVSLIVGFIFLLSTGCAFLLLSHQRRYVREILEDFFNQNVVKSLDSIANFMLKYVGFACVLVALVFAAIILIRIDSEERVKESVALLNTTLVSIALGLVFYFAKQRARMNIAIFDGNQVCFDKNVLGDEESVKCFRRVARMELILMVVGLLFSLMLCFAYARFTQITPILTQSQAQTH